MAKIFIEETTLSNIGNAIRDKEGTSDLIPVNDMASRISAITTGGSGGNEPTDEELTITGNCTYRFAYDGWNWFIDKYGDRLTTKDITNPLHMFDSSTLDNIPFQINVTNAPMFTSMFSSMNQLRECPKIRGTISWSTSMSFDSILGNCYSLRDAEDLFTPEMLEGFSTVKCTSTYSAAKPARIQACHSLRTVPSWWYKFRLCEESTTYPSYSYTPYYYMAQSCYALDEFCNIPVWKCAGAQTSNMFSYSVENCSRLKKLTFETNPDGSPIVTQWKNQTIDLANGVGWAANGTHMLTNYNSGITADKCVKLPEDYETLKNDPDWFTDNYIYSRYNHDSAVETINSLPDTSATGTNTIRFRGAAGSNTDGGAINTLTEEEIAVAAAKGWTVTYA